MTTTTVTVSKGATGEPLSGALTDSTGAVIDLTGCTVTWSMERRGTGVAKITARSVTVVDADAGTVSMPWEAADVDTAGQYLGQFRVVLPSGDDIYVPTDKTDPYVVVHVVDTVT